MHGLNCFVLYIKSEKLLGAHAVKIDNHVSWKAHIDDLPSNLSKLILHCSAE
jgi:hypothetical protein